MSVFDMVFGCWHQRCSFPVTVRGKLRRSIEAASVTGTYGVCLDCGREFAYDWLQMRILTSKRQVASAVAPATVIADLKAA
jgi:predicted amidohydrolase